ncbi:MAG: hypothetical protein HYV99_07100 [Betaproteobacteria bacterium]|nr:hypothetical protein [Betaproteobacteria bacterium]
MFRELVALGTGHGFSLLGLCLRIFAGNHRRGGNATGTDSQQEFTAGQLGCWDFHHILLFMKHQRRYELSENLRCNPVQININLEGV